MSPNSDVATHPTASSPEKTLKIRRLLTAYLGSLITFPDESRSHLQLCLPEGALDVKEIPKEVIGIRRQYLKEVQANIVARQHYEKLKAQNSESEIPEDAGGHCDDGPARLESHLRLLQTRKHHKELQIIRKYFDKLSEINPAKNGHLQFKSRQNGDLGVLELPPARLENGEAASEESTEALTRELEKAVIRAKHQLERERRLLAEVKTRHANENPRVNQTARLRALSVTRDELVRWLDEKLSQAGVENDTSLADEVMENPEAQIDYASIEIQIKAQYEQYIEARKRLISVAAIATSALQPPSQELALESEEDTNQGPPVTTQSTISTLPFISEQLLPLSNAQKSFILHKSYATKIVNKEKSSTLDSLERLADESHLLPAYPIMARQPRFRNAAAVLGPRSLGNAMSSGEKDELVRRAEAWAFAAKEASAATEELVEERVRHANVRMDEAEANLAELETLLGREPRQAAEGDDHDEDVWLEDVDVRRPQQRRPRQGHRETGPWAGLNGKLGIRDDA